MAENISGQVKGVWHYQLVWEKYAISLKNIYGIYPEFAALPKIVLMNKLLNTQGGPLVKRSFCKVLIRVTILLRK